ncbi:hypothetical protein N9O56_01750 [Rickettsiales bacterium]|nr:hypothetical protein [Rickettsiales bacterium]
MPQLIIKIADRGTEYTNQDNNQQHDSATGHMWFELVDDNGNVSSYGFAPADEYGGWPIAPGEVKYDDNLAYDFKESEGDYQGSFEITQDQFGELEKFGARPSDFEFNMYYNGITNSCIDYTYKALDIIDFVPENYDGDVWPTWNIDNIKALPSNNSYDEQIFIGNGKIYILSDESQMTIKLFFGEETDLDYQNNLQSALEDVKQLGFDNVTIEDFGSEEMESFSILKAEDIKAAFDNFALKDQDDSIELSYNNNDNAKTENALIDVEDSDGNKFTAIKDNLLLTLKDGTKALLSSAVEMTEKAAEVTKEFVDGYMNQANKLFTIGDGIASLINNIIIIKTKKITNSVI